MSLEHDLIVYAGARAPVAPGLKTSGDAGEQLGRERRRRSRTARHPHPIGLQSNGDQTQNQRESNGTRTSPAPNPRRLELHACRSSSGCRRGSAVRQNARRVRTFGDSQRSAPAATPRCETYPKGTVPIGAAGGADFASREPGLRVKSRGFCPPPMGCQKRARGSDMVHPSETKKPNNRSGARHRPLAPI